MGPNSRTVFGRLWHGIAELWLTLCWAITFANAQRNYPQDRRELLRLWFEMPR
jgi:hypothetical protein